jgi:hypothetical protein
VREGDPIIVRFAADDPDGDAFTFSSPLLPAGATLDPATGVFQWTPGFTQAGRHVIPIRAHDGRNAGEASFVLDVTNVNAAPVFDRFDGFSTFEGQPIALRAFAFDPDNPWFIPQDRSGDLIHPRLERRERGLSDLPELPAAYIESTPFVRAAEGDTAVMPIPDDPGVPDGPRPSAGDPAPRPPTPRRRRLASATRPAK